MSTSSVFFDAASDRATGIELVITVRGLTFASSGTMGSAVEESSMITAFPAETRRAAAWARAPFSMRDRIRRMRGGSSAVEDARGRSSPFERVSSPESSRICTSRYIVAADTPRESARPSMRSVPSSRTASTMAERLLSGVGLASASVCAAGFESAMSLVAFRVLGNVEEILHRSCKIRFILSFQLTNLSEKISVERTA